MADSIGTERLSNQFFKISLRAMESQTAEKRFVIWMFTFGTPKSKSLSAQLRLSNHTIDTHINPSSKYRNSYRTGLRTLQEVHSLILVITSGFRVLDSAYSCHDRIDPFPRKAKIPKHHTAVLQETVLQL